MKPLLIVALFFTFSFQIFSQTYTFSGQILDTQDQPLIGTNVLLLDENEVTKFQGATDIEGRYVIEEVLPGSYKLKISYIGFFSVYKDIEVTNESIDFGTTVMYEAPVGLNEVVIEGKVPPVQQNGDTTSYDASQYKVLADASTEDLVTKMPGVTMENGVIQAEGESVQKVLVDGKEFFGNDASAALKNLPAEVVSKIEIFDQKSDQAEFTGFDDGQTTKTINIVTKIDKRSGQFGKGYAAYGTENHYNLGGNFSLFNGDQRISFIGQANDINIQNFSSEDILGVSGSSGRGRRGRGGNRGGGGNGGNSFQVSQQGGIAETNAFGVNFSDQWGKKTEVNLSYFVNQSTNLATEDLDREFINAGDAGGSEVYSEENISTSTNVNHRINGRIEHKFTKNTSINFRPGISYQSNDGFETTFGETDLDDLLLNSTDNVYDASFKGWNLNNSAFFRHRFGESRRTVSVNFQSQYNSKVGNSSLNSLNRYFSSVLSDELIDQIADLDQKGWNNSANVSFTNPINKTSMLSLEYRLTLENDDSSTETFNANETGAYSELDQLLSNVFRNDYVTHAGGLSYNYRLGKSSIMARTSLQYANLNTDQSFPYEASLERSFLNVIPFVMWRYNIDRSNNLRVIYRTNTRKPSLSQLQEVIDNSNPLQLNIGNSALDQQFQHSVFARLKRANTEKGTVFYALVGGNVTQDYIGNNLYTSRSDNEFVQSLRLAPGAQLNQSTNFDGYWDFRTYLTYGFPIYPIKSNMNVNLSANFSNTPGAVNDLVSNSMSNVYGGGVSLSSNISEKIDFTISSRTSYNNVVNTLNDFQNSSFINQNSSVKLNWILPADLVFRTNVSNQFYTGLADGFNENYWIWNMAIGKKMFKNRLGELNVSIYDLLNQNQRISREVTGNYIQDLRTNVLQRYVMVNLIYNFRNFKTAKKATAKPEEDRDRRDGRRGF